MAYRVKYSNTLRYGFVGFFCCIITTKKKFTHLTTHFSLCVISLEYITCSLSKTTDLKKNHNFLLFCNAFSFCCLFIFFDNYKTTPVFNLKMCATRTWTSTLNAHHDESQDSQTLQAVF